LLLPHPKSHALLRSVRLLLRLIKYEGPVAFGEHLLSSGGLSALVRVSSVAESPRQARNAAARVIVLDEAGVLVQLRRLLENGYASVGVLGALVSAGLLELRHHRFLYLLVLLLPSLF